MLFFSSPWSCSQPGAVSAPQCCSWHTDTNTHCKWISQLLFLRHWTQTPGWVFLLWLELIGCFPSIWPRSVPVYVLYITENTICESRWRLLRKSNGIIHTRQGRAFITHFYRCFLSYLHFPRCPPEGHHLPGMPMNSVWLLVVLSQQSTRSNLTYQRTCSATRTYSLPPELKTPQLGLNPAPRCVSPLCSPLWCIVPGNAQTLH